MSGYLVRHGRTPSNVSGLTRGISNTVNLDKVGVRQAYDNGKLLKGVKATSLKSSDRKHIVQTSNIIGHHIKIAPKHLSSLRSVDLGSELTGVPQKEPG